MENSDPKNIDFDGIYESFRLNTIHRYFRGTDSSLHKMDIQLYRQGELF